MTPLCQDTSQCMTLRVSRGVMHCEVSYGILRDTPHAYNTDMLTVMLICYVNHYIVIDIQLPFRETEILHNSSLYTLHVCSMCVQCVSAEGLELYRVIKDNNHRELIGY